MQLLVFTASYVPNTGPSPPSVYTSLSWPPVRHQSERPPGGAAGPPTSYPWSPPRKRTGQRRLRPHARPRAPSGRLPPPPPRDSPTGSTASAAFRVFAELRPRPVRFRTLSRPEKNPELLITPPRPARSLPSRSGDLPAPDTRGHGLTQSPSSAPGISHSRLTRVVGRPSFSRVGNVPFRGRTAPFTPWRTRGSFPLFVRPREHAGACVRGRVSSLPLGPRPGPRGGWSHGS